VAKELRRSSAGGGFVSIAESSERRVEVDRGAAGNPYRTWWSRTPGDRRSTQVAWNVEIQAQVAAMSQDDFTILLPEGADILRGDLNVYVGLHHLWRMVERYKMTSPVTFRVVDKRARCVRSFRGTHTLEGNWQLEETAAAQPSPEEVALELPLNLNSEDAKGNVLKMRVQET
jgi:hypothetical protein